MENIMDAADPNVSQRAAREKADSGGFMEAEFQYGMVRDECWLCSVGQAIVFCGLSLPSLVGQALSPAFFLRRVHRNPGHGAVAHALVKLVSRGRGLDRKST